MKKFFALLLVLALLVSFAACSNRKLTMKQLIDANQLDTLLETHDSVHVLTTMNGEFYTSFYLTDAYSYEKHDTWSMYLTNETGYQCNEGMYQQIVFLTRDGLVSYADYRDAQYTDVIASYESLLEKIQSTTETADQLTVTSTMSLKNLKKILGQIDMRSYDATYIMDPKTYDMISLEGAFVLDDGTAITFVSECTYNEEMPEEIQAFLDYANQTEDLRTVTLVFHSGTEKEKVEQLQVPIGLPIGLSLPPDSDEGFSLYADPACTEPFVSNGDYTSDVIVYIQ